jgi:hypothetical protein
MKMIRRLSGSLLIALAAVVPAHAQSDAFPNRVIRVIVGFAAGAGRAAGCSRGGAGPIRTHYIGRRICDSKRPTP